MYSEQSRLFSERIRTQAARASSPPTKDSLREPRPKIAFTTFLALPFVCFERLFKRPTLPFLCMLINRTLVQSKPERAHEIFMAERVGFEPTVKFPLRFLSKEVL